MKGAGEALTGLAGCSAGRRAGSTVGAGFDEETYQKAKPHHALAAFQAAGKTSRICSSC